MPYEYLDHTSEIGLLATGPTVEDAFAEAARGLFGIQVDRSALTPEAEVEVRAEGHDLEECFVEYLNAFIARQDIDDLILLDVTPPRFVEAAEGFALTGRAQGVAREKASEHRETEVKAVTYQGLLVERIEDGWRARCVVDI
ncbi:MAG: archease [Planctomycetota bacterium]|jgi:SHS2 domain-containing protein